MHTLIENISGGTTRGAHRTLRPSRLVGHGFSHDPRTTSHTDHISRRISREPLLYAAPLGSDVNVARSAHHSRCVSREPSPCAVQLKTAGRILRPTSCLLGHGFSHDPKIKITPSHSDYRSPCISREPLPYAARLGSDVRLSRRERRIRPSRLVGHGFSHDPKIKITPSRSDYPSRRISREPSPCAGTSTVSASQAASRPMCSSVSSAVGATEVSPVRKGRETNTIKPSRSDYPSRRISSEPLTFVEQLASDLKVARSAHHSRRISRESSPCAGTSTVSASQAASRPVCSSASSAVGATEVSPVRKGRETNTIKPSRSDYPSRRISREPLTCAAPPAPSSRRTKNRPTSRITIGGRSFSSDINDARSAYRSRCISREPLTFAALPTPSPRRASLPAIFDIIEKKANS